MTDRLVALLLTLALYGLSLFWAIPEYGWTAKAFIGAVGITLVGAIALMLLMWLLVSPLLRFAAEILGALSDLKALFRRR